MSFISSAAPSAPSSIFEMARATAAASPRLTRSPRLLVTVGIKNQKRISHAAAQRRSERQLNRIFRCAVAPLREKCLSNLSQQLARDDDPLDLRSSFSDRAELRVAPVFLRRVIFRVTIPAVYLDRLLANFHTHLRRIQLRHRRLFRRLLACILHPRR